MAVKQLLLLAVFCCAFSGIFAQSFKGKVTITNDPDVTGYVDGTINYQVSNSTTTIMRIDYNIGPKTIITWVGSTTVRYMYCSKTCNTELYSLAKPVFYNVSGDTRVAADTITNDKSQTCVRYNRASSAGVKSVWITNAGLPCRALWANGMTYDFSAVVTGANTTALTENTKWNCPVQQCHRAADMVFVVDRSGSISDSEFTQLKNFIRNVTVRFSFGISEINAGLVTYSTSAEIRTPKLLTDYNSFVNAIDNMKSPNGNTCTGCGIYEGINLLDTSARIKNGVPQLLFVLTDGESNTDTYKLSTWAKKAKERALTTVYAIGVKGADTTELKTIASNSTTGVFIVSEWTKLDAFVNTLVGTTCDSLPTATSCGSACRGLCACDGQCFCPSCNDFNMCTNDICVNGTNGNGCQYNTISCNDNNRCTEDSCNPASGCANPVIPCLSDPCNTATCTPSGGCSRVAISCDDNNKCTTDSCVEGQGCKHDDISESCEENDKCFTYSCSPSAGCQKTPLNCNDGKECTIDSCNPSSGCVHVPRVCDASDKCKSVVCSNSSGCLYTDISSSCDDEDACTVDTCTAAEGCKNTPVVCPANDACGSYTCDKAAGCVYKSNATSCIDSDSCTANGVCNKATGCVYNRIPGCNYCSNHTCNNYKCMIETCVEGATAASCANVTAVSCDDGNACTNEKCNDATGACDRTDVVCEQKKCQTVVCDRANGCVYTNITCDDGNKCTEDSCNLSTGQCVNTPKTCAAQACGTNACDASNGNCKFTPLACDDGNACTENKCHSSNSTCYNPVIPCETRKCFTSQCNIVDGTCAYAAVVCDDNNACTEDSCDANTGECVYAAKSCNDNDACTDDSCDTETGCINEHFDVATVCNDYNACTVDSCNATQRCINTPEPCNPDADSCTDDTCDPLLGCQYLQVDCTADPNIANFLSTCNQAVCYNETGCTLVLIEGRTKDKCGVCEGDGSSCSPAISPAAAGGIAAGAVAGIVIASVVVAAALGAFGGKKGYDWLTSKNAAVGQVNNNPLFEEANNSFNNPLHESDIPV